MLYRRLRPLLLVLVCTSVLHAQGPEVTSWIINTQGETGYNGLPSNVQLVRYSADNVYVSCTCIPGYDIGPWQGNPNTPMNQDFVFRIPRQPRHNDGSPVATPLGHVGLWSNGVSIFNAKDAQSYNNAGIWNQNAVVVEGPSFDECLGHPAPNGEYHHHLNPPCLYDEDDSSRHSPIIGYAFDGYPVYGAYGYRNSDGSGGVTRMRSSYRLRAIDERNTLPDGTILDDSQRGPTVSTRYPRGYYCEDYEYVEELGDLDGNNGRLCVTPEYPQGTYAYFVTRDEKGEAAYPYTLGPAYYGVVAQDNVGPGSGHITPTEPVEPWSPSGVKPDVISAASSIFPNPATTDVTVRVPFDGGPWRVVLVDITGRLFAMTAEAGNGEMKRIPLEGVPAGCYALRMVSEDRIERDILIVR